MIPEIILILILASIIYCSFKKYFSNKKNITSLNRMEEINEIIVKFKLLKAKVEQNFNELLSKKNDDRIILSKDQNSSLNYLILLMMVDLTEIERNISFYEKLFHNLESNIVVAQRLDCRAVILK